MVPDRVFESEQDFEATLLQEFKIADERLVLGEDGKEYYYMPGDERKNATTYVVNRFYKWSRHIMIGCASENTNVRLGPRLSTGPRPRKKNAKHEIA